MRLDHLRTTGAGDLRSDQGFSARHAWLLALLFVGGCAGETATVTSNTSAEDVLRKTVERGPMRVTVELSPRVPRLSDELVLTLTLDYQEGVSATIPPFGSSIDEFVVRDFEQPQKESHDGRETIRQIYHLEPTRVGTLGIAPFAVTFEDDRPDGDGQQHTVHTEPLSVEVVTMLDTEAPSLADLRPAKGPVLLPTQTRWEILAGVIGAVCVVIVGLLVWSRRVKKLEPVVVLSPREQAQLELDSLVRNDLSLLDTKLYYVRLTGIVRRYIEATTGIQAPEQTTEEFLREIGDGHLFGDEETRKLKRFLEAADLVKFAGHQPTVEDMDGSLDRAREFIGAPSSANHRSRPISRAVS